MISRIESLQRQVNFLADLEKLLQRHQMTIGLDVGNQMFKTQDLDENTVPTIVVYDDCFEIKE